MNNQGGKTNLKKVNKWYSNEESYLSILNGNYLW